jgi:hypothetical protein
VQPIAVTSTNELAAFTNYCFCSLTIGVLCPTVLLSANKHTMSKETFFVKECEGLRSTADIDGAPGYVTFTQGRAGCDKNFSGILLTL